MRHGSYVEGIGQMDDLRQFIIDQGRENNRSNPVQFALRVDTRYCFMRFIRAIKKRDTNLLEFDILELGEQTVSEGLDCQAGAVGNKKYCAF